MHYAPLLLDSTTLLWLEFTVLESCH